MKLTIASRARKLSVGTIFWIASKLAFRVTMLYALVLIVGLLPVNGNFVQPAGGIEVYVRSGEFHSDLILPLNQDRVAGIYQTNWEAIFPPEHFESSPTHKTHIAFGWGDRSFYLDTPSWKDLKPTTALSALLLPSESVMHVAFQNQPIENSCVRSVKLTSKQYRNLVAHIHRSFTRDSAGNFQPIADASYSNYDAFYLANGSYHCFRTCNSWVGEGLQKAGVKVGWFTPLPKTVLLYLKD